MRKKIAIIGAGFGGLTLARGLSNFAEVTVFEKARGVGGRMSTRYADPYFFDHGAQCFTARSKEFQQFLLPHIEAGHVEEWKGKVISLEKGKKPEKRLWFEVHFVASPNMNSLCKEMMLGIDVRVNTEVSPIGKKKQDGWHLTSKDGTPLGVFDLVISTAPPAQTLNLFSGYVRQDTPLARATLSGCYALMIGFNSPWPHAWIAAKVRNHPLKWISVNSSKPSRNQAITCLVAHSKNSWAEEHIDDDIPSAQAFLLSQFEEVTGIDCANADYVATHRWRYSIVENTEEAGPYFDPALGLAASSDWAASSRIEEVWLAAKQLERALTPWLAPR